VTCDAIEGNVSLSLLTCFLANSAYLVLLSIVYSLFPYTLPVSILYFILLALLLDLGIGALGGALGRKQARKKSADLSRQG
jgi:hypothetical protein